MSGWFLLFSEGRKMVCKGQFIYCTYLICVITKDPTFLTSKFRICY